MKNDSFGNTLNKLVFDSMFSIFQQGELAQLTFEAYTTTIEHIQNSPNEVFKIEVPLGWRADNTPMKRVNSYTKIDLVNKYEFLAIHQLSINGLFQLVSIVEAMLTDVIRTIILKYPQKLGSKTSIPISQILESTSIDELYIRSTDVIINELSYKSPKDFAESFNKIASVNLLECPAFHRYLETKATRDIHVHNRGIANDIYLKKADSMARVNKGDYLPVNLIYFSTAYESCLQLTEWVEAQLHAIWHSQSYEDRKEGQLELPLGLTGSKGQAGPSDGLQEPDETRLTS